jgi:hypothetical protein
MGARRLSNIPNQAKAMKSDWNVLPMLLGVGMGIAIGAGLGSSFGVIFGSRRSR